MDETGYGHPCCRGSSGFSVFVVVAHDSRQVVHTAVTTNPTDAWTTQQIREATPWEKRPKYLIHDNDGKFGSQLKGKVVSTPVLNGLFHSYGYAH